MIHKWEHKETGKIVRATPWWEIPEDIISDLGLEKVIRDKNDEWKDRKFKIGALVQVGWLLKNEHGVWMGVGPNAIVSFNDLGPEIIEEKTKMCTCEATDNVDINSNCMECGKPYGK